MNHIITLTPDKPMLPPNHGWKTFTIATQEPWIRESYDRTDKFYEVLRIQPESVWINKLSPYVTSGFNQNIFIGTVKAVWVQENQLKAAILLHEKEFTEKFFAADEFEARISYQVNQMKKIEEPLNDLDLYEVTDWHLLSIGMYYKPSLMV